MAAIARCRQEQVSKKVIIGSSATRVAKSWPCLTSLRS